MVEPIITNIAQLTPVWLTDRLYQKGALVAGAVSRVQVTKQTASPVSRRYQLDIEYTPDAVGKQRPPTLFLRLCQPEFSHNGEESTFFYNRLVPIMQPNWQDAWPFAECFDAVWSPAQQLDHLLLEDLTATHFTVDNHLPPTQPLYEVGVTSDG